MAFTTVPAQTVSVVAALTNGVLTAYRDANRYSIVLVEPGVVTAAALFQNERRSEGRHTWILRGVGFVTLLVGLMMLTRPLTMLFAVLPFLESLVGAGAFLVSLTLAIPITLATIAIAWIVHRPAVGVGLLVAAVAMFALLRRLRPSRPASG